MQSIFVTCTNVLLYFFLDYRNTLKNTDKMKCENSSNERSICYNKAYTPLKLVF